MKVIKNGTLTNSGWTINCLECKSQQGYVLEPISSYNLYYCFSCIKKAFKQAQKDHDKK